MEEIREPGVFEPSAEEIYAPEIQINEPSAQEIYTPEIQLNEPFIREPLELEAPIVLPPSIGDVIPFSLESLVIDVPGCVEARDIETGRSGHFDNDPQGNYVLCDNSLPVFYPADYYKGVKVIPLKSEPKTNEEEPNSRNKTSEIQPDTGNTGELPPVVIPCPPNNPPYPVGAVGKYGTAKVTGFKRDETTGECITLWEKLPVMSVVDSYTPPPTLVVSTFTVALFGASAALFASPVTKLLTKTLKPISKQIIKRIKTKLGKTEKPLSRFERRQAQREKRAVNLMWRSLKKR